MIHSGCNGLGSCVGRLAPTVAVSNGGSAFLPVSRQDAPGVSGADTHQRGCLIQRHVLSQQTVQNLKSRLFFGIQCHFVLLAMITDGSYSTRSRFMGGLRASMYFFAVSRWMPSSRATPRIDNPLRFAL